MRTFVACLALAGCAASSSFPEAEPDSVRARLESSTPVVVTPNASSGAVTARRRAATGWVEGTTPVGLEGGTLAVSAVGSDLVVDTFELNLGPIDIPEEVFNKPTQLTKVRLRMRAPTIAIGTWNGDNSVTARPMLDLDLEWALTTSGGTTPLGTQHLPPIPVNVSLAGDGNAFDATLSLASSGSTLWKWANLIELTGIELSVAGASAE